MKSADIKVGGFYAVKDYSDPLGARAEVLAVGVARHYASGSRPGRLVRVRKDNHGEDMAYSVSPAQILREWNEDDDKRVAARQAAARQAEADLVRLRELVAEHGLTDVARVWGSQFVMSNKDAIAFLEGLPREH